MSKKTWIDPQIFVLGVPGTQAGTAPNVTEGGHLIAATMVMCHNNGASGMGGGTNSPNIALGATQNLGGMGTRVTMNGAPSALGGFTCTRTQNSAVGGAAAATS